MTAAAKQEVMAHSGDDHWPVATLVATAAEQIIIIGASVALGVMY